MGNIISFIISIINKSRKDTNLQKLFIGLFLLSLFFKTILTIWQYLPLFNAKDIELRGSEMQLSNIEILEKSNLLRLEFYNPMAQDIQLGIDTNRKWDVYLKGELIPYSIGNNNIIIKVNDYRWGQVDLRIEKHIPFRKVINFNFILTIFTGMFFQVYKNKWIKRFSLLAIFFQLLLFIWFNFSYLTQKINLNMLAKQYQKSQYVMGQGSSEIIGDEEVYALAAVEYLKTRNPVSINFEHPPLAKYLFGIGILLTQRPRIVSLIFYLLALLIFYLLCKSYLKKVEYILPALMVFIYNELFLNLSKTVMLDLPQLLFILLASLFFIKAKKTEKSKWLIFSSLAIGAMAACKFYLPAIIYCCSCFIDLFINHNKLVLKYLLSLVLVPIVYVSTYFGYFSKHSFLEFVKFQWWLWNWFMGKKDVPQYGMIFSVLLTGKVKTWWELENFKTINFGEWNVSWPAMFFIILYSIWQKLKNKIKPDFILIWIVLYLLFLSFGAFSPNLLIIVIPFMIIYSIKILSKNYAR